MDAPTLGEFAEYVEALPGRLSLARRGMPQHSVGSDPVSPARSARLSRDRAPGRADDASAPYRSGRSGSRTLSGGLRILGDTHPDTFSSLANLALVQGQIGGPLHARPPRGEHGVRILIDDCVLQETLGESLTDSSTEAGLGRSLHRQRADRDTRRQVSRLHGDRDRGAAQLKQFPRSRLGHQA